MHQRLSRSRCFARTTGPGRWIACLFATERHCCYSSCCCCSIAATISGGTNLSERRTWCARARVCVCACVCVRERARAGGGGGEGGTRSTGGWITNTVTCACESVEVSDAVHLLQHLSHGDQVLFAEPAIPAVTVSTRFVNRQENRRLPSPRTVFLHCATIQ